MTMSDQEQDDLRKREADRKAARSELIRWLAEMLVDEAISEAKAARERSSTQAGGTGKNEGESIVAPPVEADTAGPVGSQVRTQQRTRRKKTPTEDQTPPLIS